tara:strand:- start:36 stop:299 length:264 start_codon:yes stop_codon:yes gene_type:complete
MELDFGEIYELLVVHKMDLKHDLSKKLVYFLVQSLLKQEFVLRSVAGKVYKGKMIVNDKADYVSIIKGDKESELITVEDFIEILRKT